MATIVPDVRDIPETWSTLAKDEPGISKKYIIRGMETAKHFAITLHPRIWVLCSYAQKVGLGVVTPATYGNK